MSEEKVPNKYAVLMETSADDCESWYFFLKYQGNEEALQNLQKQLQTVDWAIEDGLSTFDLETNFLVSETTAKEMTKIDLNSHSFHRKFDGVLKPIDLDFRESDSNRRKMKKTYKLLGDGQIENFIDKEDIDPEDLAPEDDSDDTEVQSEDESESYPDSESESESPDESDNRKKKGAIPLPRFAKAKASKRKAEARKK